MVYLINKIRGFYSNSNRYRGHRVRSIDLTNAEIGELRAMQRTFEGAYVRSALASLTIGLVITKIFQDVFYPIGMYSLYLSPVISF